MPDSRRKYRESSNNSRIRDERLENEDPRQRILRAERSRSSKYESRKSPPLHHSSSSSSSYAQAKRIGSSSVPNLVHRSASGSAFLESRSSLPYPSFSKAHSREAVNSHEDFSRPRRSPYTPEPTDFDRKTSFNNKTSTTPPSPPLTSMDPNLRNTSSRKETTLDDDIYRPRNRSKTTSFKSHRFSASRTSLKDAEEGRSTPKQYTAQRSHLSNSPSKSHSKSTISQSNTLKGDSPLPTQMIEVFTSFESQSDDNKAFPPPPPPPPPNIGQVEIHKVDYLLQNGGLAQIIPKSFAATLQPISEKDPHKPPQIDCVFAPYSNLLESFNKVLSKNGSVAVATGYRSVARRLLDRLEAVFARNISSEVCTCIICRTSRQESNYLEVETGVSWGEVLELVSNRRQLPPWPPFSIDPSINNQLDFEKETPMQKLDIDVPEEYRDHYIRQSKKTKQAVQNWLAAQPTEPPVEVDDETLTFAMLTYLEPGERKIFTALRRGLEKIPETLAPTPSLSYDVQSDLMSRIGLSLQRLYRLPKLPREPESCMYLLKNPSIHNALATLAAISNAEWDILISGRFDGFLWSGAEDQFQSISESSPNELRNSLIWNFTNKSNTNVGGNISRGNTPITAFRNPSGGPVQVDEETEMAVLAEVEREIFLGMEALEDAFEALHVKAQGIRRKMMERAAGLALSAQMRRREAGMDNNEDEKMVRLDTPAVGEGQGGFSPTGNKPGINWGLADAIDDFGYERSELAPDDSASNIGSRDRRSRHRKRRSRRTPALVKEEDEKEGFED